MLRVVDLQGEIVPGERPVQGFGDKAVEWHTGRCNLALQLLEGPVRYGVLKSVALHVQFRIALHNQQHVLVVLPHQLDEVRKCAILAALVDSKEPDEHIHVATGRQ